jgi:glycosyltransferase involved in cell wall biosynthesis
MICLDLKTLTYIKAGIGRYCINLSSYLLKRRRYEFSAIMGPESNDSIINIDSKINLNIKSSLIRSYLLSFSLPENSLIFHSLDNSSLNFKLKEIKTITTIHDVIVLIKPELFSLKHRIIVGHLTRSAIENSDHIITVSNSTRREILELFPKINSEKITVTHEASDIKSPTLEEMNYVFKQFPKLPENYLLSLCTFEPRKNLKRLVKAYRNLRSSNKISDIGLVLVGGKGWLDSGIDKSEEELHDEGIIVLGFVEDKWLPAIYSNALAFIYPSLHEGFGLPPLEAMSSGAPVLMSNTSSLPEVGGEAAIYFDPLSIESIEVAIEEIVFDTELRKQMSINSLEQSKKFSWEKTAEMTEQVYAKVLDS